MLDVKLVKEEVLDKIRLTDEERVRLLEVFVECQKGQILVPILTNLLAGATGKDRDELARVIEESYEEEFQNEVVKEVYNELGERILKGE